MSFILRRKLSRLFGPPTSIGLEDFMEEEELELDIRKELVGFG